ncbi:MAG: response regulator transcription factor [Muribaculaceae bacterium]|nr:response regulator transcription factor [Muribaculaceae bacterium]
MSNRILFVEDESDLSLIVADTLRDQGYEVVAAIDGIDGLYKFKTGEYDIVVADVMMPRMDGFSMAREIRRISPNVPLLFLTAKSTVDDVEEGFEIGANDYLKKPFELRELLVRIKALLRRNEVNNNRNNTISIGAYTYRKPSQALIFCDNETQLSYFEARILELLAANIGKTVDASELMMAVWQRDDPSNRNSLHGYIHKLRRALRHDTSISIINQRGFGYMLSVNDNI